MISSPFAGLFRFGLSSLRRMDSNSQDSSAENFSCSHLVTPPSTDSLKLFKPFNHCAPFKSFKASTFAPAEPNGHAGGKKIEHLIRTGRFLDGSILIKTQPFFSARPPIIHYRDKQQSLQSSVRKWRQGRFLLSAVAFLAHSGLDLFLPFQTSVKVDTLKDLD